MLQSTCRFTTHNDEELQLNLTYPLSPDRRTVDYHFDLYIYTTFQLGISPERYEVSNFLDDMRTYTRFANPNLPLKQLLQPDCDISPIIRIRKHLDDTTHPLPEIEASIQHELRMLSNILHRQLATTRRRFREWVEQGNVPADAPERLDAFIGDIDALLEQFRELLSELRDARFSHQLAQHAAWADEALSLDIDKFYHRLYECCAEREGFDEICSMIKPRLKAEQQYRESCGYPTVADPRSEVANEKYLYRESKLKKWAQACLYMNRQKSRWAPRLAQILMGIAAGVAMTFAVITLILANRWFSDQLFFWSLIIVISYIFKDRIKEGLKGLFIRYLPRLMSHRMEDLIDPATERKVGYTRERMRFLKAAEVEESVRLLRNIEGEEFRQILPAENVLHFHKFIKIRGADIQDYHKRVDSITEIIRLNMSAWLRYMDHADDHVYGLDDGKPVKLPTKRVYHVNTIIRLPQEKTKEERTAALFRHRLIMSRFGIERVEFVKKISE